MEPGLDLQTATAAGLQGMADPEVLLKCADEKRILLTHDFRKMPAHFAVHLITRNSPGVIIIPQDMPIGQAIEEIFLIWATNGGRVGRIDSAFAASKVPPV